MKVKVLWKSQEAGGARNVDHLLSKAMGSEQRQPEREAIWVAANKSIGDRRPKLFGAYILPEPAPGVRFAVSEFNICAARFWSCLSLRMLFCALDVGNI